MKWSTLLEGKVWTRFYCSKQDSERGVGNVRYSQLTTKCYQLLRKARIRREAPDSQMKNISLKQSSVILERGCKDNTLFTNKTKAWYALFSNHICIVVLQGLHYNDSTLQWTKQIWASSCLVLSEAFIFARLLNSAPLLANFFSFFIKEWS